MSLTSKQIKAIKILDKKLLGRKPLCDHPADIQDLYQEALLYITTTNAPTTASTMCRNGIYAGQHAQEKFNRCGITYNTKPSWNSTSAELQRLPPISDCGYDYECANTNSTDGSPVIELTADLYVEDTVISNLDIKTAISTLPARTYPGSSKLSSPVSNIDPEIGRAHV